MEIKWGTLLKFMIFKDALIPKKEEKYCPKCDNKLELEKEIDYPYICWDCDENFYEFETLKN